MTAVVNIMLLCFSQWFHKGYICIHTYACSLYLCTYIKWPLLLMHNYDVEHNNQKATDRAITISEQSRQGI